MVNKENKFLEIHKKIIKLGLEIIKNVTKAINDEVGESGSLNDYKIVWDQLQNLASPEIEKVLKQNFNGCKITTAKSKSTYPDIKMEFDGFIFAIDIKSNESSKDPWYDIARLDTIEETRIKKYHEEYDLVIKYDSSNGKLLTMYFMPLRETVGIRLECGGIKYRPYDGKVRPKTWADFSSGKVYWKTKESFLIGINKSKRYRLKEIMKEHSKILNEEEKGEFRDIFK